MTPEGKKLFKRAFIILGTFFAIMVAYNLYSRLTSNSSVEIIANNNPYEINLPVENLETSQKVKDEKKYSAKINLSNLLHSYAYNYYRSNRIRKAIKTWEIARYLNPKNKVIHYRIEEARIILNNLVQESISLGAMDFKYIRYNRAINHWERAARLVKGIDEKKYNEIQSYISIAERQLQK